jgi:arylsulfatase
MVRSLLISLLFLGPVSGLWAADAVKPPRPNVVLIMADDMGFSDLGCYGSEIATPNLDKLAASGLRFTQFYNTARCCPTRATLLTGLYSHQAGIGHMVENRNQPGYQGYLNDRCVTIGEAMRLAGYQTGISGKWHVGENRPHWPVDRGFDKSYSLISGATNYFRLEPGRQLARGDQSIKPDENWYITDAITENAVSFLGDFRKPEKPFFLYVAYTSPHWPLHAHPADIAKYRGKYQDGWDALRKKRHARMIELGLVDAKWPLTPRDPSVPAWEKAANHDDWDLRMAVYAAQIDRMDQGIGKVVAKLKDLGIDKNTLVMFLSDNGGCAEIIDRGKPGVPAGSADSFFSYGVGWANASNTPFRLYKHWVHEGGISTPLIAHWPAVIEKPGLTSQPGHLIDLMATCIDAAGGEYPKTYQGRTITPLEGKSLRPIFEGKTRAGHDAIFWEHEGNRAVRQGKWKLVARFKGAWELYDLEADRTEMTNLAEKQPEKVKELAEKYEAWAKRAQVLPWEQVQGTKGK